VSKKWGAVATAALLLHLEINLAKLGNRKLDAG